jgi:hypothetical protein
VALSAEFQPIDKYFYGLASHAAQQMPVAACLLHVPPVPCRLSGVCRGNQTHQYPTVKR